MKTAMFALLVALGSLSLGCANNERSRDLGNPDVSATTLAQQVCSNCHGVTGNAISPNFPNLAGQVEPYLIEQLNAFKSHNRQDPAGFEYMWGLSRSLTEDQIKGLAAYYASQTPARQPIEGDPSRLEAGKAIFEHGVSDKSVPPCSSCHGPEGQGAGTFPRLAGQHADYVMKQLVVFQRTDERPEGAIMKVISHGLTQQNMEDVSAYVQSVGNQ
jgi:cytochrome c553